MGQAEYVAKGMGILLLILVVFYLVALLGSGIESVENETGYCQPIETRNGNTHWKCKDGREYWRLAK